MATPKAASPEAPEAASAAAATAANVLVKPASCTAMARRGAWPAARCPISWAITPKISAVDFALVNNPV